MVITRSALEHARPSILFQSQRERGESREACLTGQSRERGIPIPTCPVPRSAGWGISASPRAVGCSSGTDRTVQYGMVWYNFAHLLVCLDRSGPRPVRRRNLRGLPAYFWYLRLPRWLVHSPAGATLAPPPYITRGSEGVVVRVRSSLSEVGQGEVGDRVRRLLGALALPAGSRSTCILYYTTGRVGPSRSLAWH
ncbi:unnamed protein product [Diplocarpon coronariae]|nr:hypothetical protein JHW43_001053 [Diplocarpon mali]